MSNTRRVSPTFRRAPQRPHPLILLVAFYDVQWDVGIADKLAVVLIVSLLVPAGLAWALSRAPTISLLFGAKRRQPALSDKASLH